MRRPQSGLGKGGRNTLQRYAWASLVPFLAAALLGSLVFRRGGSALKESVLSRHPARQTLEKTLPCLGGDCTLQGGAGAEGSLAAAGDGGGGGAPDTAAATTGSGGALGAAGDAAAAAAAARADGSGAAPPGERPKLFLFIGILSGRGYRHRRLAVRESWANRAQVPGEVVSKFILSEDERTPQVEKELEMYGDIVFVGQKTNYKSILYKTFYVLEYAVQHYDAAFVLKTDDDAFINVPPMIAQLRALCENPGCAGERIYMGRMARHSEVLLTPGHKWNNAAFHNHTGLNVYPNYMMGGGYVMGGEVARVLVDVHNRMHLKFTPIEDATLGFWLMAMDLRHVDHPKFFTWAAPCCFKPPVRKPGERFVTRFALADEFEGHLCDADPWLVLHKIDSPTKMRYVGAKAANCSEPEPWVLPGSIQQYFSNETRQHWAEQRVAFLRANGRPMDPPPSPPPSPPPPSPPAPPPPPPKEGQAKAVGAAAALGSSGAAAAAAGGAGAAGTAAAGGAAGTAGAAGAGSLSALRAVAAGSGTAAGQAAAGALGGGAAGAQAGQEATQAALGIAGLASRIQAAKAEAAAAANAGGAAQTQAGTAADSAAGVAGIALGNDGSQLGSGTAAGGAGATQGGAAAAAAGSQLGGSAGTAGAAGTALGTLSSTATQGAGAAGNAAGGTASGGTAVGSGSATLAGSQQGGTLVGGGAGAAAQQAATQQAAGQQAGTAGQLAGSQVGDSGTGTALGSGTAGSLGAAAVGGAAAGGAVQL